VFAVTINGDVVAAAGRVIISNLHIDLKKPDEKNNKKPPKQRDRPAQ
jgi:hypothetical protein